MTDKTSCADHIQSITLSIQFKFKLKMFSSYDFKPSLIKVSFRKSANHVALVLLAYLKRFRALIVRIKSTSALVAFHDFFLYYSTSGLDVTVLRALCAAPLKKAGLNIANSPLQYLLKYFLSKGITLTSI